MSEYRWRLIVRSGWQEADHPRDEEGRFVDKDDVRLPNTPLVIRLNGKEVWREGEKYDPGQPRVPAGQSEGGQWAPTGKVRFTDPYQARAWLKKTYSGDHSIKNLERLTDEEALQVGNAVADVLDKANTPYMVNNLEFNRDGVCMIDSNTRTVTIDPSGAGRETPQEALDYVNRELERYTGNLPYVVSLRKTKAVLERGEAGRVHSIYWFPQTQLEGIIRHEYGHGFHDFNKGKFDELRRDSPNWEEEYGVTIRAQDNWSECVAENFTAWSIGQTGRMNPKMVKLFDSLAGD